MALLTRQWLYAWVWSEPMAAIATELNFSRRWVRQFCGRRTIPHPPRGYWRRCETGHARPPSPLPQPETNPTFELEISSARAEQLSRLWEQIEMGQAPLARPRPRVGKVRATPGTHLRQPSTPAADDACTPVADTRQGAMESQPRAIWPEGTHLDAATLASLASQHAQLLAAQEFLNALQRAASDCEPVAAALIATLVESARTAISALDPTRQVIAHCTQVAQCAVASVAVGASHSPP